MSPLPARSNDSPNTYMWNEIRIDTPCPDICIQSTFSEKLDCLLKIKLPTPSRII
jgi:hypothetical protein